MAARDAVVDRVWGDFKSLCSSLRTAKGEKGFKAAVERLQDFMSDDLHRQLVHRWRGWGLVLNDLLRVVKEELSKYLYPGASGRKRKVTAKMASKKEPQLGYWHYLRTELEAAHVAGDGPVLHFDPNGRECLRQLFAFSALVVGSDSSSEYEREFETRVETEAWRTIEVIAQFRVYCAVLDKNELTDVLELALGLLERSSSRGLFDNTATAAVRARAIQLLLKNCPFELHEFLPALLEKFAEWFGSIEPNAILDSLTVAVILLETLTDLMRAYFASIGPSMLKYGVKVLKFIARSWGFLPNGLRGYPAEFIMQFLELYRYNADGVPNCKHLVPATLLKEMKMLVKIVVNASELNRMVAHVQSARGSVIGRAKSVLIDFDDQGMRHLACAADIIFHHDRLVSDRITEGEQSDEVSEYSVGDKRPRSTTTTLAWEIVVENVCGGPRAEGDLMTAASLSMVSPSYLSVGPSQLRGVGASQLETKQPFDSASWLLLLLSVLTRHGDYYITNRIGDLMLVMKKLGNMLVVKEMGKQQSAALQTLIQLANLSAQYREECGDNFDEHWTFVWHSLLRPELPYARATEGVGLDRGQAGDAVLTLLNCCVSFGLVPIEAIEARSSELWDLPAFRKPTSELLTATKPRAESLSPYARTSMASTCALLSFLLHVQLPPSDGIPTRPIQGGDSFDSGEEIFENEGVSVHSRLLRSVFDQLQTQIFRRDSAPFTGRSASASMKTDMQTEVSSVVYASAIRAFFPQTTVAAPTRETIFLPELIRKLAARSLKECESELTGGEFSGFGVSFCMHENGLEYLSQPFPASEDVGPAAFSPVIQAFVNEAANSPGLGWSGGLKTDAIKPENHFEGLAVPTRLLQNLVPLPGTRYEFPRDSFPSRECYDHVQSISKPRARALQSEIGELFSELLAELSSTLCSNGVNPARGLGVLANAFDIGLVLAVLFAGEESSASQRRSSDRLHVIPLLKRFLAIAADYLKPAVIEHTRRTQYASEKMMHILMKFHAVILILQGHRTLEICSHPSADPVELRTPSDLRLSIRNIVNALEELLASFSGAGGAENPDTANRPSMISRSLYGTSSSSARDASSWEVALGSSKSSSQTQSQLTSGDRDAMDEGDDDEITRGRAPSRIMQRSISLWCFRVILMLKKDSGLACVTKFAMEVHFELDFLLAVAVLLCGVAGSNSLDLLVKLVDFAATEASRDTRKLVTRAADSFRTTIFISQVLTVLRLAGLLYEKRKSQQSEAAPVLLLQCAKKHLETFAGHSLKSSLRMARTAELQCLQVFFRFTSTEFETFEDISMDGTVDEDMSVRVAAAQSLQSMLFMYPEGGPQVFRDCFERLKSLLPGFGAAKLQPGGCEPGWCMDACLSVLLSLYVCACSSHAVLPEVLAAFVGLASSTDSLYATGTPSIISGWLRAIAEFYGYSGVASLLDDHFCHLWHQHIAASMQPAAENDENDPEYPKGEPVAPRPHAKVLLGQFPLSALLGEECDANTQQAFLMGKIDVILPVAVLHDSIAWHGEEAMTTEERFEFVDELVVLCFRCEDSDDTQTAELRSTAAEQLTTDLFALSFILQSYPDPTLHELSLRMLAVAEARAQTSALSFSHLGHITSKMARFTVWDIIQAGSDQLSHSELWKKALAAMKGKYSGFDWELLNLAELLCDFHVLLLRTERFDPQVTRAVECFQIFVIEIRDALVTNPVLQRLLLSICFQSIKHLTIKDRKEVGSTLTLLIRETCECFMKNADTFGKYLGFVVQEISEILACCDAAVQPENDAAPISTDSKRRLTLTGDDQAKMEWVIFAVCNNMASGLGKYVLELDLVPKGISASLDKLNGLITGSRKLATTSASQPDDDASMVALGEHIFRTGSANREHQAKQQIERFIDKENARGLRFYNPLPTSGSLGTRNHTSEGHCRDVQLVGPSQQRAESSATIRLSVVARNIGALRGSSNATKQLYAKLAHALLYLSAEGDGSTYAASLADALGALGALDANEYELSPSNQRGELSRLYKRHFHRSALRETKTTFTLAMQESLLAYLSSLLFERKAMEKADPAVLQEALMTLKSLLSIDTFKALERCRDNRLKAFLNPFKNSSPSNWSSSPLLVTPASQSGGNRRSFPRTTQQHVELWASVNKVGFDSWVCCLTSYLASQSSDLVLKACSALVAIRTDMAVFLFPFVLESILGVSKRGGELSRLAKTVNQGIRFILTGKRNEGGDTAMTSGPQTLNAVSSQPLEVVQLVVHTINFLRETEKARFVESNGNIQQSPAVGKGKLRAQPPVTGQHQPNEPAYGCVADVDLLAVAVAAVRVKMPYSAMQYVEMWLEKQHGGAIPSLSTLEDEEVGNTLRDILVAAYSFDSNTDGIYGVNDGRTLGSQLVKYNREGEYAKALPLYDVSLQFSDPHSGGRTASDPPRFVEGMLMSLQTLGYKHLLEGYLQSAQQEAKSSTSAGPATVYSQAMKHKYELAWKNLQWEAVLPGLSSSQTAWQTQRTSSHWHQQTLFRALRAIVHDDFPYLQHVTTTAKGQILQSVQLSLRSFESTQDSYTALLRLQSIREIEELAEQMGRARQDRGVPVISAEIRTGFTASSSSLRHMTSTPTGFEAMPLFNRWQQRYAQIHNDFDKSESLLALEEALLQVSQPSDSVQVLTKLYLNLAAFSRKAGRVAVAYRALTKLEQLDQQGHLGMYEKMQWKLQKAKLLWSQQEGRSAIWMAKKMRSELAMHLKDTSLSSGQTSSLELLHVAVLTITGKWIASQRSESSQVIIEEYFQKATELVNSMDPAAVSERVMDAAKAHFALAEYMADMYQQVGARVTSREWLAGKAVADARRQELAECLAMDEEKRRENQAHIHALNKEVVYDSEERSKVEASVDQFLTGALYSYGKGLSLSPRAELDMVFRVLSLWFNNQNKPHVNRVVQDEVIHVVPSYKFVPLSYQIISRVSGNSGTDTFQMVLSNLVMKLSEQHPHHTLVQLIALKNSGDVEGKGALQFRTNVGEAKSDGAKAFLAQLRKTEQAELLESLDILANAYLQLALFDTRAYHKTGKKIALTDVPILGLNPTKTSATTSFDQCLRDRTRRSKGAVMPAVLTAHLAPRADMDYSAVVRVLSFAPLFSITDSGIHRPKIIYCQGSDGRRYKQLVKGHDDTRQDLVIEQAFETVNQFLAEEHTTRKRKLRLRTYRVVPLSPIAGVLEWVENTMPWGSYLVGRSGNKLSAHERYHPQEWKHANCRAKLKNAPNKLTAFSEIQANFTPVFHHFFLEKYPDAAEWYSRRLAYVQSVAVTSIVGYILGIGDRHSQNILIHEDTGELVHIDFGVVFDQGMALFTPETVPFRLTRDMVDGMGVSGVDGVFSRCCEATLQLLRKKSASVVTILEVFVHDPLYRWTLSPLKALRIQEGEQDGGSAVSSRKRRVSRGSGIVDESSSMDDTQPVEGNKAEANSSDAAARALIRVKQKLQGYEDPNGNALSIEGQVKHLMSAAQNPHNLCNLFPGWAPWL